MMIFPTPHTPYPTPRLKSKLSCHPFRSFPPAPYPLPPASSLTNRRCTQSNADQMQIKLVVYPVKLNECQRSIDVKF